MLPGLMKRVKAGIGAEHPEIEVIGPPEKNTLDLAWLGGSILAQEITEKNSLITVEVFRDHGPAAVHNKCF